MHSSDSLCFKGYETLKFDERFEASFFFKIHTHASICIKFQEVINRKSKNLD